MKKVIEKAKELLEQAKNVLIISHRRPDCDTLGAAIAFKIWLSSMNKNVTMACKDKISKIFNFLPYTSEFIDNFSLKDFDLMIVVDSGASYMTDFHLMYPDLFKTIPVINIDHHASNDFYGTVNIVDSKAASTTLMIYKLFKNWGVKMDSVLASCLLCGIYTDTGSFMHSNTNKEVFEASSDLMEMGAKISDISKNVFKRKTVSALKIWGRAMEKADFQKDGVVFSVVRKQDYDELNCNPDELSGVIDYLNMVPNSKYAVLIAEDKKGNVKGSFRTRCDDVDLSKIAANFGGGGHKKASGFCIPGKLEEQVMYQIVTDEGEKTLNF
ncbi:MAG: bifunctional oligoribonuclease/PAP phosphatase NrnA [Candidatus Gracilibacteria bacterium]|jgi:phosphoesterase RecJ-like protein